MNLQWLANPILYFLEGLVFKAVVRQYKRQGVLAYLRGLQAAKRGLSAVVLVLMLMQTAVIGVTGILISAVFLYTKDECLRLWLVLGIFALLGICSLLAIGYLLSDRLWYRLSGANNLVNELSNPNQQEG